MIKAESFVPGRIYSVVYNSDVEMVRRRRGTSVDNPLADATVTVRRVSSVQAAGNKTWTNYLAKQGLTPAGTRAPWWTVSDFNSCIVVHNTDGRQYLRALPRGVTTEQYFVNGIEATDAQVETIRSFKKSSGGDSEFVMLSLAKLVNVDAGTGEQE